MASNREVVITGMGVVTPLGHDVDTYFANLLAGKSGVGAIERFDASGYATTFAGEVRGFDPTLHFEPKEAQRTSRYIQYLMHASLDAVKQAGLDQAPPKDLNRAGVILGSGMGGMEVFTENAVSLVNKGHKRVSPFFVPMSITNMGSGMVSIRLGWRGPNWAVTSACTTANHAIATAADQIRLGRADVMLAGGAEESVCPVSLAGFSNMKALSRRNDAPQEASRPFDKNRDGFVLGEGGGALVLESREHAEARGAKILAVLRGYGMSNDAYHMSAPLETGEAVAQAMRNALADAGMRPEDIGVVNPHATSTPLGDAAECKALGLVFGAHLPNLKVTATKSMVGHLLGGTSATEAVALIMCLNSGKLHPTINVRDQDPDCPVDCVPNIAQATEARFGISNSFGFGGHNSCVVFEKGE
ncbi:MAG: 3-oxoacyl-(acyl-carrier-protein) synthase [Fibrobacteria bacterium]|nr:3-oxoacyl-(acyl-carrier-protein) synthase [Fibrobacteria bacterium]